jgi:hypothetical protein
MRINFDGLCAIITTHFKKDPLRDGIFYGAQKKWTLSTQINSHFLSHYFENNSIFVCAKTKNHQHFNAGDFSRAG